MLYITPLFILVGHVLHIIGGVCLIDDKRTDRYYRTDSYMINDDFSLTYQEDKLPDSPTKIQKTGYAKEGSLLYLLGGG